MFKSLILLRAELFLYITNHVVAHVPSRRLRKAFYRYVLDIQIGPESAIHMGARFDTRHNFSMGSNSVINERCRLDNRGGIVIGSNVSISADVIILTADHDVRDPRFTSHHKAVNIGDHVFIGTRAIVLPGVTIGEGAVVAAASTVTRDIAPYTIVAGNPARQIADRPREISYKLDYDRFLH